jgi:hypothetical protein
MYLYVLVSVGANQQAAPRGRHAHFAARHVAAKPSMPMPADAEASSRLSNALGSPAASGTWLVMGPPGQAEPVPSAVPGGRSRRQR